MDGPTDVDALAEALRVDGVVVDRVMGSGEAQEAHDRIATLVRETPFPVYVALVETPEGVTGDDFTAPDSLATLLQRRLGEGMYVLHLRDAGERVYSFGLGADAAQVSLSASSNRDELDAVMQEVGGYDYGTEDYVYPPATAQAEAVVTSAEEILELGRGPSRAGAEYPATLDPSDAERIARHALEVDERASWTPYRPDFVDVRSASTGLSALVGGLTALVVGLLLGQTLRGWPRRAAAPARAALPVIGPPDRDEERERAAELTDALAQALAATDWDEVRDRDLARRALTARDAAEPLLDSRDPVDLVGAQVLARAGARDLARGRRGRGGPLRTCFFDPRHPDATSTARWRLGDGFVEVPCCRDCGAAVVHDGTPAYLRVRTLRGTLPYWERDDVWARTGLGAITDDLARDVLADRAGER